MKRSKSIDLADFPVIVTLPLQWGDQDAFGHVNNAVHIRWFESARVAYLERGGMFEMMSGGGVGPILASITCHYRRQLTYPDTVQVGASVTHLGRSTMVMDHVIYSESLSAVAADGQSTVVTFDYSAGRPRSVPDEVRKAVESLEGKSLSQPLV